MTARPSSPRFLKRPAAAVALLIFAAAAWTIAAVWYLRSSSVRQHLEAGRGYVRGGNARQAEREWREAIRLDPRNVQAWQSLAEMYASTSHWLDAADAFGHVLLLAPATVGIH